MAPTRGALDARRLAILVSPSLPASLAAELDHNSGESRIASTVPKISGLVEGYKREVQADILRADGPRLKWLRHCAAFCLAGVADAIYRDV